MSASTRDWKSKTRRFGELDFDSLNFELSTDRYHCQAYAERERNAVWLQTWQVVGRVDELPKAGDWKEHRLFNQSYIIVRGADGELRGFVNACRHRGNKLCQGKGNSARFTCPYHLWSYGLDGRLVGVARPDLVGPIDKSKLGLLPVPVDCFAGFIFLNPDSNAMPLLDFIGADVAELLAPYRLEEMVPVGMDVKEALNCNWKVVMDAFSEGYHIIGVHPELLSVTGVEAGASRHGFYGDHRMVVRPFEVKNLDECSLEQQVEGIRSLTATFPSVREVLPLFEQSIASYRNGQGELLLPEGVTVRGILQQATRASLTARGMDVSGLTDDQMSDNQAWYFFPNFFATIRAGEMTTILPMPHPSGDAGRCLWHVTAYKWLPEAERAGQRAQLLEVQEPGSYPYFLALQQDYDQMQRQQEGLSNLALKKVRLVREEVNVARFHQVLDGYMANAAGTTDVN
ncbi:aromatic ring-hydroxylating dioxygenase subunit alpha [Halioxenophilus sp. WMMB6]|uniref:aromatic ring-hydroxylating oxygenase subunit alpha n=1 Tax=Halioxenophilus sp. WMMB6 TaxID=3073815 RepID=UPI00295F1590|nr:aromatic ring-hydroxylating dioxygenase subunit alpha [Halioxenophilus sp. WMMB6]